MAAESRSSRGRRANGLSRRGFLARGAAGAGASLVALAAGTGRSAEAEKVRVGYIGVGGRGTTHLRTMLADGRAEVTWVCDLDPTRLEAGSRIVAEKASRRPSTTEDHRRVLEAKDVDAVLISTPCDAHAALYLDTIAAGKDLYAEKPMAITVAECDAIVKAAEASKRIVQVGFQSRYNPRIVEGVERIRAGDVGEILEVRGAYLAHFGPLRGWQSKRARSGDWMVEQAVHFFDLMNWALGGLPACAEGWGRRDVFTEGEPDRDVTDYYSALLEYPGGVIVNWLHSWLCPADGTFNRHTMHFMGRKGGVDLNEGDVEYMDRAKPKEKLREPGEDATLLAHRAFLECVRTRKAPFSGVRNGRDAVIVGLLVRQAVDRRRRTTLGELEA